MRGCNGHEACPSQRMPKRHACVALCLSVLATAAVHAQSTVVELNDAGWKMLQSGEGARAGKLFAEALALKPNDPVLLFGAGAAAHLDGRPRDAMGRLQRALEFNPGLTGASLLLGQIAYAENDVATAIVVYEKALKYAPNDSRPGQSPRVVAQGGRHASGFR